MYYDKAIKEGETKMTDYEKLLTDINPILLETRLYKSYKEAKDKVDKLGADKAFSSDWIYAISEKEKYAMQLDASIESLRFFNDNLKEADPNTIPSMGELNDAIEKYKETGTDEAKEEVKEKQWDLIKTLFAICIFHR